MRRVLVVGGTGPTGPHVVRGLAERGFAITLFHTGTHEIAGDDDQDAAEHLHGNPFDRDDIHRVLAARTFDVVVATYGRTRLVAEAMQGRCDQFVAVSGMPIYRGFMNPSTVEPTGIAIPTREDAPREDPADPAPGEYPVGAMRRTEDAIFALNEEGAFRATVCRFPILYGPRDPAPREWSVVRRVLDGREWILVPNDGLNIYTRCGARNAAEIVLLAIDQPDVAGGEAYNCADEVQYTLRQWVEVPVDAMGASIDIRSIPGDIPNPGWAMLTGRRDLTPHGLLDNSKARYELGYHDVVAPRTGLGECVSWCQEQRGVLTNSPHFVDRFDYAAEDRLLHAYERALGDVRDDAASYEDMHLPRNLQTAKSHQSTRADRARP
jgi:nucleoside-diphosphate-sugar epimerase